VDHAGALGVVASVGIIEIVLRRTIIRCVRIRRVIGVSLRTIGVRTILILRMRLRRGTVLGLWRTIIMRLLRPDHTGKRSKTGQRQN